MAATVGELKQALNAMPDNYLVVIQYISDDCELAITETRILRALPKTKKQPGLVVLASGNDLDCSYRKRLGQYFRHGLGCVWDVNRFWSRRIPVNVDYTKPLPMIVW